MTSSFGYEHTVGTTASCAAVWALWQDAEHWPAWDTSIAAVELDGPFRVGATGTMRLVDGPTVAFRLTDVTPGVGFVDVTEIPGAVLTFSHTVTPTADGATVTHRVDIVGEQAAELGPMVTADVPDAMAGLVAHAQRRDRASSSA